MIFYLYIIFLWTQKCPDKIRMRPDPKIVGLLDPDPTTKVRITDPGTRSRKKNIYGSTQH